jgi:hypothetical protein
MFLLPGCGAAESSMSTSSYDASYDMESDGLFYEDAVDGDVGAISEDSVTESNLMIARTADVSVTVEDLTTFDTKISRAVNSYGGYFENQSIDDYASEYSTRRYGSYTIRIPADKLDTFLTDIGDAGTITSQSVSAEDVSLEYVDVTARLSSLESERDRLNELLTQAELVSDIIEIESQLSTVQYQIESYTSQKKLLEGRVNYSTVYLYATENREVSHPFLSRINVNIKEDILDSLANAVSILIGFILALPVIAVVIAIGTLLVYVILRIVSFLRGKKSVGIRRKHAEQESAPEQKTKKEQE